MAASLAILVSISAFALFVITLRHERKIQTVWRALGFSLLALAFIILIYERKDPSFNLVAVLVQAFALYFIYRGVKAEPILVPLLKVETLRKQMNPQAKSENKSGGNKGVVAVVIFIILILLLLLPGYLYIGAYLPAIIEGLALLFVLGTILIQIKRYRADSNVVNLYPMIGYIFLAIRGIAMILYRLPEPSLIFLRKMTLDYSLAWQVGVVCTFFAFVFLGLWAWKFIKVRVFLRSYVVFITLVIVVSTVGALVFTLFIFKIIENNNLELMMKGAETESVIMNDRANTAVFISRLVAEDQRVISSLSSADYSSLFDVTGRYLESAEVDILRVYNTNSEIIASPSDPREQGQVLKDDKNLQFALVEKRQVRTFDTIPGVLADFVVTRALYPIILNGNVIGVVEVGYKFDNAFVDFSKEKTNLDVTIYSGIKISATTIKTQDQVTRYVGSEESNSTIINTTLKEGKNYNTTIDRFGEIYYSAYSPIRDVNGQILGMVSVGTPTHLLLDAMRQQLLTTFILVSLLSALISLVGYYMMPGLRLGSGEMQKK